MPIKVLPFRETRARKEFSSLWQKKVRRGGGGGGGCL